MNKQEFLAELQARLAGIPQDDAAERISFYREMIDDRVEDGLTEEQAIAELGTLESITGQIMLEIPLTKLAKEKAKASRSLKLWEIVLLALGAPIWLSLAIALCVIVVSIYAVIWSSMISLWAIESSFAVCSAGGAFAAVVFATQGNYASGTLMLGAGSVCAGLAIFGFFGCKYATIEILKRTKRIVTWTKSCFCKKEAAK